MAKEVSNVEQAIVQPHPAALEKVEVTVECDDGSSYIFEKPTDRTNGELHLARRVKPDGSISTSRAALPTAVRETMAEAIDRWQQFGFDIEEWSK